MRINDEKAKYGGSCAQDLMFLEVRYNDFLIASGNRAYNPTTKEFREWIKHLNSRVKSIQGYVRHTSPLRVHPSEGEINQIFAVLKGVTDVIIPINDEAHLFKDESVKRKVLKYFYLFSGHLTKLREELSREGFKV
ncbi:MAG TPA: hypothetical protein VJA23_03345 [Candidatus Nanoarchaeia archaeon]|nr:hypothetical protein [Candidatus Nanoarchaeia archaeon]